MFFKRKPTDSRQEPEQKLENSRYLGLCKYRDYFQILRCVSNSNCVRALQYLLKFPLNWRWSKTSRINFIFVRIKIKTRNAKVTQKICTHHFLIYSRIVLQSKKRIQVENILNCFIFLLWEYLGLWQKFNEASLIKSTLRNTGNKYIYKIGEGYEGELCHT